MPTDGAYIVQISTHFPAMRVMGYCNYSGLHWITVFEGITRWETFQNNGIPSHPGHDVPLNGAVVVALFCPLHCTFGRAAQLATSKSEQFSDPSTIKLPEWKKDNNKLKMIRIRNKGTWVDTSCRRGTSQPSCDGLPWMTPSLPEQPEWVFVTGRLACTKSIINHESN